MGSSAASGVPPETCATHGPGLDRPGDLGDRAVGHAEQAQIAVLAHGDAALAQPRGDRGAGAPGADDGDLVEHVGSSSGVRIPGTASVLQR